LSPEQKRFGLHTPVRRTEPDDIEAQVKALQQLQKQGAFISKKSTASPDNKPISRENHQVITDRRPANVFVTIKQKWEYLLLRLFRQNHK